MHYRLGPSDFSFRLWSGNFVEDICFEAFHLSSFLSSQIFSDTLEFSVISIN